MLFPGGGVLPGSFFPGSFFPGGFFPRGLFSPGAFFPGGFFPRGRGGYFIRKLTNGGGACWNKRGWEGEGLAAPHNCLHQLLHRFSSPAMRPHPAHLLFCDYLTPQSRRIFASIPHQKMRNPVVPRAYPPPPPPPL